MDAEPADHPLINILLRHRPRYGWLAVILLAGTMASLILSVLDVDWVPQDGAIVPVSIAGFALASLLAQRRSPTWLAWVALVTAGILLSFALAADLVPGTTTIREGYSAVGELWRLRTALFMDRVLGWWQAVRSGGRSTETIPFSLGLTLAAWFVAALLPWSAYRTRQPFLGLSLIGIALGINTYYGRAGLYWVVIFFGLAATAGIYLHHLYREEAWERDGIDYSTEIRAELLLYTAGISLGIMSLAITIPAINFRAMAEAFQSRPAVVEAEQTLARAFAGVQQPRTDEGSAGGGGLPRSFLLGGAPELAETVVMTATLRPEPGVSATDLAGFHWRSMSFDIYTGRGWRRSPEREQPVDAGRLIPDAAFDDMNPARAITVTQQVDWIYDRRATRYTIGQPVRFSHDLTVLWRGTADLVGVRGRNNAPLHYEAQSRLMQADLDQLNAARLEDVPPEIRARYTTLPDSLPARVRELARQAAGLATTSGALPSPFKQARAIEKFLRQYPYSLDVPAPPPDIDLVDFFLFDLQTGFCDYYATAMVVMARAVGLPARLGVGYLQTAPDSDGVQTIRQINAHSWAEVYFAPYGWVEFEPTAPFAGPLETAQPSAPSLSAEPTFAPSASGAIAIPDRAPSREPPWSLLVGVSAFLLVGWLLWGRQAWQRLSRRNTPVLDEVQLVFAHLQDGAAAMGRPPRPTQTPYEFSAALLDDLTGPEGEALRRPVEQLTTLFNDHQYGGGKSGGQEAQAIWLAIRGSVRRLVWRKRLGRAPD